MLASPEQLAIDEEARHAENARRLRCVADHVMLAAPLAGEIVGKSCRVGAGLEQHRSDDGSILDVELAPPEPLEDVVVVGAEDSRMLALRPEHTDRGERGVPDLPRPQNREAAFSCLAPAIHVRISYPPPLVSVAR